MRLTGDKHSHIKHRVKPATQCYRPARVAPLGGVSPGTPEGCGHVREATHRCSSHIDVSLSLPSSFSKINKNISSSEDLKHEKIHFEEAISWERRPQITGQKVSKIHIFLIDLGWGRGRDVNLLLLLFMRSLAVCALEWASNPQPWCIQTILHPNELPGQGYKYILKDY